MAKKATKGARGSGTIRQRPDGRWEARYTVGRDPATGKQVQHSIYGKTQKEVAQKLRELTTEVDNGTYQEVCKMTVSEWLDIWLEEYTIHLRPTTISTYRTQINVHIRPAIGRVKLYELKTEIIQRFYNSLYRSDNALSPKTVKNIHGVLHKALAQAVSLGYIRFNPADNITLPKVIRAEIKPITDSNITLFLDAIRGHRFELLYKIDLFTGMRKGEILGLTWDCVDLTRNTLLISKQLIQEKKKNGKYFLSATKNGKSRSIRIPQSIADLFAEQKARQDEWKAIAGDAWNNEWNLVFTDELGHHLSHTTVTHCFKRIVRSIGLDSCRFHDLRHSYAVAALQSGGDIKTIQENLGHYTAAFTLDIYGHVSEEMKRSNAEKMDAFIRNVTNNSESLQ